MEKSNSKTSYKYGSGGEGDDRKDGEHPTTSREDTFNPLQISHNMKDLEALDFNSADEVRQAMKAVLAGKIPPQNVIEEASHYEAGLKVEKKGEPIEIDEVKNKDKSKNVPRQVQQNLYQRMKTTAKAWTWKAKNTQSTNRLRRPGRPPKAGPSYGIKKPKLSLSSMYLGKLSNVVSFKCQTESESESDAESVVKFY